MLTRMAPLLTRMARMARLLTRMARMLTRMTRWLAGSHIGKSPGDEVVRSCIRKNTTQVTWPRSSLPYFVYAV